MSLGGRDECLIVAIFGGIVFLLAALLAVFWGRSAGQRWTRGVGAGLFLGKQGVSVWEQDAELRFTRDFRVLRDQPVIGRRRDELWDPGFNPCGLARHLADLDARRPFSNFVYRTREIPEGASCPVYYRSSGRPIFGLTGRFLGYCGIVYEVTEIYEARRAVEESYHKLTAAIEGISAAFVLFDSQDRLVLFNQNFARLCQPIAPYLVPGAYLRDLLRLIREMEVLRDMSRPVAAWVRMAMRQHRRAQVSGIYRFWNGARYQILEHLLPDGGVAMLLTDVTEACQREEALRYQARLLAETLDTIGDGLVVCDESQRLLLWNNHFAALFTVPDRLLKAGTPLKDLIYYLAVQGHLGKGSPGDITESLLTCWMNVRPMMIESLFDNARLFEVGCRLRPGLGFLLTFQDITERRRFDQQLRDAKDQAETANRAKSNFLATMSHELLTPLNAIIGFSEIIEQQMLGPNDPDRYLEYVRDIHASGSRLLSVINDILDLARIESGKYQLRERPIDLQRLMANSMRLLRDKVEAGNLSLTMTVPDTAPMLLADERAIRQILLNLLSNAIKFTEPGGSVALLVTLEAEGGLCLRITDTGIGILASDLARVMAPFGQVDNFLTRRFQGTGLGLPLVKSLTELHNGEFIIESEVGKGTCALVRFPAARVVMPVVVRVG